MTNSLSELEKLAQSKLSGFTRVDSMVDLSTSRTGNVITRGYRFIGS